MIKLKGLSCCLAKIFIVYSIAKHWYLTVPFQVQNELDCHLEFSLLTCDIERCISHCYESPIPF